MNESIPVTNLLSVITALNNLLVEATSNNICKFMNKTILEPIINAFLTIVARNTYILVVLKSIMLIVTRQNMMK